MLPLPSAVHFPGRSRSHRLLRPSQPRPPALPHLPNETEEALREQAKGLRSRGDRRARDADKPTVGVDQGALKTALDRIYAVEEAMAGLRRDRWQVARDLLTPEQQVKFLMYSVKFHKEMRERLEREHGGRRLQSGEEQEKP